jgi:hypothetical protein
MRKSHMLATASVLALGAMIGYSATALADGPSGNYNPGHNDNERPQRAHFAGTFAYASNSGEVYWNWAITTGGYARANIDNTGNAAQGVLQINQNVGPNSLLQNSAAVSVIQARAANFTTAVAYAFNWGDVAGNWSQRGTCEGCGGGTENSANINNSFGRAQGVLNVNQNAGDNSLLQNSSAVAVFRYCGEACANVNLSAVAVAANYGEVRYNFAEAHRSTANATISNSLGNFQGVLNLNQNAGANSLLQNASAIASIQPAPGH